MMLNIYIAVFFLFNLSYRGESTNECSFYIDKMVSCFDYKYDEVTYASAFNYLRNLENCGESIMEMMTSSNCTDKIVRKMIETRLNVIKISRDFILMLDEFGYYSPNDFTNALSVMATYWMAFTPSFLSSRGCKLFEIYLPVELRREINKRLTPTPWKWNVNLVLMNEVYNVSFCKQRYHIPNEPLITHLYTVLSEVDLCLVKFKNFSECNSTNTKSQYYKCVEKATLNKIVDPKLRFIEKNAVAIAKNMEEIVCQNETINKAIELNKKCLEDFIDLNRYFYVQINRIYTVDGCYGLKYQKFEWMNQLKYTSACPVTRDYWNAMNDRVKCIGTNLSETKSDD